MAYLQIDSNNAPLIFQTADREGLGRGSFDLYKNTQAELLRTPFVLNKALANEDVKSLSIVKSQPNAYEWLSESLEIGFPNEGEVMLIKLETSDANASASLVNAVVNAYMDESVLDERNERLKRLDNLQRVYSDTEGKVRQSRAEIRKLTTALGTSDSESLSVAQQMSIERYGQVQSELGRISFELMRAEGELAAYKQIAAKLSEQAVAPVAESDDTETEDIDSVSEPSPAEISLTDFEIEQILSQDRAFQQLLAEKRTVQDKIAVYRTQYGEGMIRPELAKLDRLESEIDERSRRLTTLTLEEKRQRSLSGSRPITTKGMSSSELEAYRAQLAKKEKAEAREEAIAEREIRIGILKQQKTRIEEDLTRLESDSQKLGRSSVDVEMMRAEIASLDEVLARLSGEIERTKIELKAGSRVSVISDATKLENAGLKKRLGASVGLGLLGFVLPFVGFVGFDARKQLINNVESIASGTGITVLGSVPRERHIGRQLSNETLTEGAFGNSVNSIVAMLVNQSRFEGSNVLMVTSAVAGEGKSTLAQSLWQGLAEANYRTLLLDFDLRRPSIHGSLGTELGMGLGDVIRGEANWDEVVRERGDNCFYITAGNGKHLNLAAAAHGVLPSLFREARANYDFVIVDTAPILPVVDTRVIGEHVDAAVLSVMKDRSRLPQMVAARETLLAHGTPLMGVVVSGCKPRTKDYGYYY
ncbi:MAG: AAA family ATPase [Rubripirellula sp.]